MKSCSLTIFCCIKNSVVIDPAVGSGAFPVGILQEITGIRLICENKISNNQKSAYSIKKEILENNIYGVDIDHGAIDIARLRFWLSLVVEADLNDVEPLPNLDFKLVAANSLLALKKEEGIWDERDLLCQMKELREKYFRARTRNGKEKIQNEFNKIIRKSNTLLATDRQKQISTYNPFSPSSVAQFFDSEFMFGVNEFDIVLGNPPYVDSETMVRSGQGELRDVYSNLYESARGNWDLFIPFIEKGMSLNKNSGTLAFIVPNKLISQNYANKIRQMMISNTIIEIRDYSRISVFLNVDVYPVTFILKKEKNINSKIKMTKMDDMVTLKESNFLDKDKMTNENWDMYFSNKENISIIEKINCYKKDLSTLGNFESPCTVSEAYNFKKYLIDGEYTDGYKKLINSGTIDKYLSLWGKKDTKYIKDSYKKPIILETKIKEVGAHRTLQSNSPKVIIANMTSDIEAFLDLNGDYLAGKSTAICLGEKNSLKIVTAFLNSHLISFWYKTTFHSTKMAGGALSIAPKKICAIPIPDMSDEEKLFLINRVDKIIEITANKDNNYKINNEIITPIEKEIDCMVYRLYGLTNKEIENVEKS